MPYQSDSLNPFQFETMYSKAYLFAYLPESTCWPCVYNIMTFLEEANPHYLSDSSLVFISFVNNIYYGTLGKEVVVSNSLGIDESLEENNLFLFQLDPNGKIISLHIVTNIDIERTQKYVKHIYGER